MVSPVNKKTGQIHAPISTDMQKVWEGHAMTRNQFDYVDVTPAPEPIEAKKVKEKPKPASRRTKTK